MKVAYNGFTKYANALEKPPFGITNLKMCIKEACKELNYDFVDYSKNADCLIVELPLIGGFNYSHIDAAKTMQMLDTAKKVVITFDDLTFIRPFLRQKKNIVPFTMRGESLKFQKRWLKFVEDIRDGKYSYIQHTYEKESLGMPCKKNYCFDYSFLSKYTNRYKEKEKRPVSASVKTSLKIEDSSDILVLSNMTEQECFQKLCEHRVCYIRNYTKSVARSCVRTRFTQAYYANALVVGLEVSPFSDDKTYCVSLDEYHKMSNDEFERKVELQKETFLNNTMSRDEAIEVIRRVVEDD